MHVFFIIGSWSKLIVIIPSLWIWWSGAEAVAIRLLFIIAWWKKASRGNPCHQRKVASAQMHDIELVFNASTSSLKEDAAQKQRFITANPLKMPVSPCFCWPTNDMMEQEWCETQATTIVYDETNTPTRSNDVQNICANLINKADGLSSTPWTYTSLPSWTWGWLAFSVCFFYPGRLGQGISESVVEYTKAWDCLAAKFLLDGLGLSTIQVTKFFKDSHHSVNNSVCHPVSTELVVLSSLHPKEGQWDRWFRQYWKAQITASKHGSATCPRCLQRW